MSAALRALGELALEEFQEHSPSIEADVYEHLGAACVAGKYLTEGAAGPKQAGTQVAYWKRQLGQR